MKKYLPDLLAILFFVVVSCVYFLVPIRDGLVLTGNDHSAAVGSNVEMEQYRAEHHGERTRWTNTLFSGMPTYQMSPSYPSTDKLGWLERLYQLFLPTVAGYVFMMLLGFYILLRAFDFRAHLAALGAVLWAFSSYYFIIIQAGHIWKLLTLCFIPPTIAGMVLCYRGKYLLGTLLTGIFLSFQILSNHVQMTYYFLFVLFFLSLAYLIQAVREKTLRKWFLGTACFAVGGILGVCVNLSNLYHTWEYSKESMRGKSELTQKTKDPADQTDSGLERSYITAWSYGKAETLTLLIPDFRGGASVPLSASKTAMKHARQEFSPLYGSLSQYWGEQPGTSGPVYVGAFVLLLFVLSFFLLKGPFKWCMLAVTVLSVLLSWGKNFMSFTDFFLDYFPMYDKFRTVASILVIAEFTIPLLAVMGLREWVAPSKGRDISEDRKALLWSFLIVGGCCLLFWIAPGAVQGDCLSSQEVLSLSGAAEKGYIPKDMLGGILSNISEMHCAMLSADAFRSFVFVLLGTALLFLCRKEILRPSWTILAATVLCLIDLWGVNKRYLNDSHFSRPKTVAQTFPKSQADEAILQDPDLYYRVLDRSASTFNDNGASYYHKSIGGYHAAKLRRYNELIQEHIAPEMSHAKPDNIVRDSLGLNFIAASDSLFPVLNMLNTKYFIFPLQGGEKGAVLNPGAQGNAWFASYMEEVPDADAEIEALRHVDLRTTAVVASDQKAILGNPEPADSTCQVTLTQYGANELSYEAQSSRGGILVFSEVYYPGWTCMVDGQSTPIARVNYVLRAIHLEPGTHQITLRFDPQSVHLTETVAYAALLLLTLLAIFLLYRRVRTR